MQNDIHFWADWVCSWAPTRVEQRLSGDHPILINEVVQLSELIVITSLLADTYDHRVWRTGLPVRSAVLKPHAGRLVVWWVTTCESLLLYVFYFCLLFVIFIVFRVFALLLFSLFNPSFKRPEEHCRDCCCYHDRIIRVWLNLTFPTTISTSNYE